MRIDPAQDRSMAAALQARASPPASRRTPRRQPWLCLVNALLQLAQGRGELIRHCESAWASVTFSGTRHSVTLAFAGAEAVAAGEALIAALPEHEFAIPGQLVADAAVRTVEHRTLPEPAMTVEAELLLLDES